MTRPILIAGPTASGKSALALALAEHLRGAVINADSQQVYRDWRILTARPSPEEEARAPHFLYGHVALDADYSVGAWLRELAPVLEACRARGLRPIIAGGTGLYFKALTRGLAPIPPIPAEVKVIAEAELESRGLAGFAVALAARDPESAAALDQANPVRLLRAWEVLEATGRGLADWRRQTAPPLVPLDRATALALVPPREHLRARCDRRLDAMVAEGVLDEVARVMRLGLDPALPGMKAVGALDFMAYLSGECSLNEAVARAKVFTGRYAKRQVTWIRNQMATWAMLRSHSAEENLAAALARIENPG